MNEKYYNDDELVYLVGENFEDAFDLLLRKYEPLIKSIASYYVKTINSYRLEYDDILQECRIAFLIAVKKYDYTNSVLFYTFLLLIIRRRVGVYMRSLFSKKNNYVSLDLYYDLDNFEIEDDAYNETSNLCYDYLFVEDIVNFKNELDSFEACVFELRFNRFSYKEIATLLDVNIKKIDNEMVKIRKKLKNYLFKCE